MAMTVQQTGKRYNGEYDRLEDEWKEWGAEGHCASCSTGTEALYLALAGLCVPRDSYVAVPQISMIAAMRAVQMLGAHPVPVQCDREGLIDPIALKETIQTQESAGKRISAVIVVHLYGRRAPMEKIATVCKHIPIVEDCAEYHIPSDRPDLSAARCWSFYRNKVISGAEGGMVASSNSSLIFNIRILRNLGRERDTDCFHADTGISARMSNPHARLVRDSLAEAPENIRRRNRVIKMFEDIFPEEYKRPNNRECPWVYDFRIPRIDLVQRASLMQYIAAKGVVIRPGFSPIDAYLKPGWVMRLSNRIIRLEEPSGWEEIMYFAVEPNMDEATVDYCVEVLKSAVGFLLPG